MFNGTLMKLYIFPNSVLGLKIMDIVFSTFFHPLFFFLSDVIISCCLRFYCLLSGHFTNQMEVEWEGGYRFYVNRKVTAFYVKRLFKSLSLQPAKSSKRNGAPDFVPLRQSANLLPRLPFRVVAFSLWTTFSSVLRGWERGLNQPFFLTNHLVAELWCKRVARWRLTVFWLATAAAALAAAIRATAAATAGTTTTPGRALCAEGRGRRAAPAASTAAATARATEEETPSASGRVRPKQREEPLALSSAADLHRDRDIHRGGGLREATGPEPATRPLSPPPLSLLPARILSSLCSQPRGSWCACDPHCG